MSWKPRKCVIALLTLATLTCFAALIAVNIKPQHDAYPSSLSIKMGQNFSLGRKGVRTESWTAGRSGLEVRMYSREKVELFLLATEDGMGPLPPRSSRGSR